MKTIFTQIKNQKYSALITLCAVYALLALTMSGCFEKETPTPQVLLELIGDNNESKELNFGSVKIGETLTKSLRIKNITSNRVTITGITLPKGFSGNFTGEITAGATETVAITFTPLQIGNFAGELQVKYPEGTNTIQVVGQGFGVAPPLSIDTKLLIYPNYWEQLGLPNDGCSYNFVKYMDHGIAAVNSKALKDNVCDGITVAMNWRVSGSSIIFQAPNLNNGREVITKVITLTSDKMSVIDGRGKLTEFIAK